jgi:acetoin utilization deacetylase AcuC-like enzyme
LPPDPDRGDREREVSSAGRIRRTGLVYHERYLWHDAGAAASVIPAGGIVEPGPHAESPERIRRINSLVEVSGLGEELVRLRPRPATHDELHRFHTSDYVEHVRQLSDGAGGDAGEFAPVNRSSYEIAVLAAGGCLTAVDAVVEGHVDNAYALVRPPGHHALPDKGMGGCIFLRRAEPLVSATA